MASDTQADTPVKAGAPENHRALVAVNNRFNQLPALPWPYAGPAPRPEILTSRPSPFELLHALRRRWLMAVGLGMLTAGLLAGLVWLFVPVRYEAVALVRVHKSKLDVFGGQTPNEEYETYKRTQLQLIKSNFVLVRAARKPDMVKLRLIQEHKDDPVSYLDTQLQVEYPGDAELLKVSMKAALRDELPVIINAVVEAYMDEIVNAERNEQLKRRDTLDRNHSKNLEEIRKKTSAYHALAKQLGTANSESAQVKKKLALQQLDATVFSRNKVVESLREQGLKILLLNKRLEHPDEAPSVPEHMVEEELMRDPMIAQNTVRAAELRRAIKESEALSVDHHSLAIKRMRRQLAEEEETIDERKAELRPRLTEKYGAALGNNAGAGTSQAYLLPLLETEQEALQKTLEAINDDLAKQTAEVQKLDANSSELEARHAELDELRTITSRMGSQLRILNLELENQPRIQVVERASKPQTNDALRKYAGVGFAAFLGFGLVLFGVAYLEFQGRRLNSGAEVKDGLGLSVIGELPPLSGRSWRKMREGGAAGHALQAILTESIDSIRTTLIHTTKVDSPRVVMVTSAEAHEGKTTVASQLAASLARSGRRTLLVDCDVRSPAAHRVFELSLEPGLCEVLRGELEYAAAVQPTSSANLWLLTAGRCDARSIQALSQAATTDLIAALKADFEFVIIDSGPVLKVADPLLVGQHVDAAVLSALRDISTVPRLYEASERLSSVGVTVLGVVVNGINDRTRHYASNAPMLTDATAAERVAAAGAEAAS
jgi:polysaccharide biosynthesis transport protein